MAGDRDAARDDETAPLLGREREEPRKWGKSILYRALLCGFMVSLSFGVTQVPYVASIDIDFIAIAPTSSPIEHDVFSLSLSLSCLFPIPMLSYWKPFFLVEHRQILT